MRQQIPRRSTLKVAAAAAAAASLAVGAAVFIFPGGWRGGTALLWAALVSALVVAALRHDRITAKTYYASRSNASGKMRFR